MITLEVDKEEITTLNLKNLYKIICIQPLGSKVSSIVLESLKYGSLKFLSVEPTTEGIEPLKFVQLGVNQNYSRLSVSKLIKYRSVCKYDKETKKKHQVGVVVRENGRVEFYSDFILVNEYYNPGLQCIDIATDFNQFFLKFVKNAV